MKIAGFERLSLVDFDTLTACTLFTDGCNFRCPFCHNAPLVVGKSNDEIPWSDIENYLSVRKNLIDGVCITGGEPTLYKDLPEYIKKIKNLGFKVKLDTNGTNPKMLESLVDDKLLDYVAMDIKNSFSSYAKTCGKETLDLAPIKESIAFLKENKVAYEFRTTIVCELHSLSDIEEISEIVSNCQKYFLQKFTAREGCIEQGFTEVELKKALEYKNLLVNRGINAYLRGYDV